MSKLPFLRMTFVVTLLLLGISEATAQVPVAIDQVNSAQQRRASEQAARDRVQPEQPAPELFPMESNDVGPQSVLSTPPRKTLFEAVADIQYFHTDNMFLTEHNKQEAGVLLSTAQFALAPSTWEMGPYRFSPRVGYRHEWYDYGLGGARLDGSTIHQNEFDFNAQTAFADMQCSRDNWIFGLGFDFTRLMTTTGYDEFYKEYVPRWGVQRLFPVCERAVFSLGYEGDYRFSEANTFSNRDFNDRTDHAAYALCTMELCKYALLQPYYRFKYTRFTADTDRQDYLHSVGVALYCFITPQFSLRAFAGYDWKSSDGRNAGPDYDKLDAGGGLNLTLRF
jgi:hypothetical protein